MLHSSSGIVSATVHMYGIERHLYFIVTFIEIQMVELNNISRKNHVAMSFLKRNVLVQSSRNQLIHVLALSLVLNH